MDTIHERFTAVISAHGPQAILPLNYAGPHGFLAGGSMDLRFFHRLGASLLDRKPLCGGIRTEAWVGTFGTVPGIRPEQAEQARLIVVWGNNVTWSNLHLMPRHQRRAPGGREARGRGSSAHQGGRAGRPAPGPPPGHGRGAGLRDRGRAGAGRRARPLVHRPSRGRIRGLHGRGPRATRRPWPRGSAASPRPTSAAWPSGTRRSRRRPSAWATASSATRTAAAASARSSPCPRWPGSSGCRGGGLINGAGFAFPKTPQRLQRPDLVPPGTRTLNIVDVGAHLLDPKLAPPIQAVFIYNHNPLVVHPDQNRLRRGLRREDLFVVGCDVVMTDSMAFSDIVLPACSHFEHDDLFPAYGHHWLQRAEPVIPRQGEALPNTEIFRRLAARFGFQDPCFTASDAALMDDAIDPDDPRLRGVRPSRIPTDRALAMTVDGADAVLFGNVFPKTASGKVELASPYLEGKYAARLPSFRPVASNYPLTLLSPASDERITSTFGGLNGRAAPRLDMHPADASARGLEDGARVRVWNDLGEVHLTVRVTDRVPAGVVCTLKGAWLGTSDNGQTVSALCPAHHADLSQGACFNDARVEVAAFTKAPAAGPR